MKVKKLIKKLSKNTMVSYGDTGGNFLCNRRVGEYADYGFELKPGAQSPSLTK